MARLGFISITAILILFFALSQALGGSGNQAASIAGTPAVPSDPASWPPRATCPGDDTLFVCDLSDIYVDGFVCSDPDGNLASCVVSPGTLHGDTVCFTPMAGANTITLIATDQGGAADTCETMIYVVLNSPPVVSGMTDSTLYLCYPQEICLTVNVFDPDDDIDSIWVNRGNYENGKVCFIPYDSGHYEIIVTAVDSCGNMGADTALVVIETDQGISIECPNDTTIFTYQLVDTFCLPISGIPENAEVEVWGISTWYDAQTQTICFWSECSNMNHITVHVTTPCNTYSCEFTVTVECNSPPLVILPPGTTIPLCETAEICLPVGISDVDNNLADVIVEGGFYDPMASQVCFTADTAGTYVIRVTAVDSCEATDWDEIAVEVMLSSAPYISYELIDSIFSQCAPEEICIPVDIGDVDGNLDAVTTSFGYYDAQTDEICFTPHSTGRYCLQIIATDLCGLSDTAEICVIVEIGNFVQIDCPSDTDFVLCEPDTLCRQYTVSSDVDSVTVTAPAYLRGQEVCVPLLQTNDYLITMTAYGECGVDTCMFTVTAQFNRPPVVDAGDDTTFTLCDLSEICLPFTTSDPDTNIVSITCSLGVVDSNQVCFTPGDFGTFEIVITATDECGASDSDTVVVTVNPGDTVTIFCPQMIQYDTICGPDTVPIFVPIMPDDAEITISPPIGYYDPNTDTVHIGIESGGTYEITVIAEGVCGTDTCEFTLEVELAEPPVITCPEVIDTTLCLVEPVTLCYPVVVTGSVSQIRVNPIGSYSDSQVCIPMDTAGTYQIMVAAEGPCGADTCYTTINVKQDQPPRLFLPDYQTFERCLDDTDLICIRDTIYATDVESPVSLTMTCGADTFTYITDSSGVVCFLPDSFGVYEFCFEAFDSCNTTVGSFLVEILEKDDCDVCVRLSIDGGECTPVGVMKEVDLRIETNTPIGGFDILLKYDVSVMTFQSAHITGTQIEDWEYFTYNFSADLGLIRFAGLAETNDGPYHPPDSTLTPNGVLIVTQFLVTNDQNLGGYFLPISFVWFDCGDNVFSDPTGNDLYVDLRIFNAETLLIWNELDDVTYPESDRPYGLGAPDPCVEGGGVDNPAPIRCIEFINGGILVIHPDSFNKRGDINLNGIPNEIADAVLFSNYFIYGLGVFTINVDGQTAASDVNADGMTLTVGDLVYLIRIIIGDADPIPKVAPYAKELIVSTDHDAEAISIATEAVNTIGAALFVYDISGDLVLDEPHLSPDAEGMDLMWTVENGELKMLIYNIGTSMIPTGVNDLVEIPCRGDGQLKLIQAEVVDYQGRPYKVAGKESVLPTGFALNQNYPNPFNPTTTISFRLPQPTEWRLGIFNITGSLVREYRGSSETGAVTVEWDGRSTDGLPVASGVYLYRLEAANFSDSKKMILLK